MFVEENSKTIPFNGRVGKENQYSLAELFSLVFGGQPLHKTKIPSRTGTVFSKET